jgi:L-asparagine transporter-like permease
MKASADCRGFIRYGITWAGTAISIIMVSAVFSTMLVSMFGLGRMMRSLTDERLAPHWLLDRGNVPHKGILFSGLFMLLALGFGLLFPRVYLFLISSAGFSMLFCYAAIVATHIRFRAKNGCPGGKCQLWGFPYTSCLILVSLLGVIASMPFVKGQSSGLSAGIVIVAFFSLSYLLVRLYRSGRSAGYNIRKTRAGFSAEFSKELTDASKNEENK